MLALLGLASGVAWASHSTASQDLTLTGQYNTTPISFTGSNGVVYNGLAGGGNLMGATLDGVLLPYVYCMQYAVDVYVPGDFPKTEVNREGYIDGPTGSFDGGTLVKNAGEVAWLMVNEAPGADDRSAGRPPGRDLVRDQRRDGRRLQLQFDEQYWRHDLLQPVPWCSRT